MLYHCLNREIQKMIYMPAPSHENVSQHCTQREACFHHSRSVLEPINTHDYSKVI